jgi:DNA-binding transcriptional regulator YhcF (GntR family)
MRFDVRPDSPIPIYEQIVAQIIFGIASGMLEAGMSIPSVRELAIQLTVNSTARSRTLGIDIPASSIPEATPKMICAMICS